MQTGSLAASMALAFAEIEGATKAATNPHFGKKYADLGAVIDAIKPALIKQSLFFVQCPEPSQGGVTITTILCHASGEQMDLGKLFVPADKNDAQKYGSALSYARRYALMTAFGVPAEDDDGNAAARSAPRADPAPQTRQEAIAAHRDDPFPNGPAKNKTQCKDMGRELWSEVEGCGDEDELVALLEAKKDLIEQIQKGLPAWWGGGKDREGRTFEGLEQVIERRKTDFVNTARNPIVGG